MLRLLRLETEQHKDQKLLRVTPCIDHLCGDCQASSSKETTAELQTQLAAATSQAIILQQATDVLNRELSSAKAQVSQLKSQIVAVQQQSQHDRQAADAAAKSELALKERSWKVAMATAVATAVADHTSRDEALRKCLRAEVEAAAKQDKENLKNDSSAAMQQQAAEWQAQLAELRAENAAALLRQAANLETKYAQQAQHAAAEAEQFQAASLDKLEQSHTAAMAQQAQHATEQLADCKQRYKVLSCASWFNSIYHTAQAVMLILAAQVQGQLLFVREQSCQCTLIRNTQRALDSIPCFK